MRPSKRKRGIVSRVLSQKEALTGDALPPPEKETLAWEAVLMYEESL
jgi:hypothetical protein